MNFLRSYTYTWWQIGIFKLALLAIGAAAGAYWHEFFAANLIVLSIVAILATAYTMFVSFKQSMAANEEIPGL